MFEIERKYLLRENGQEFATPTFFELYSTIDALVADVKSQALLLRQGYLLHQEGMLLAEQLFSLQAFMISEPEFRLRIYDGRYFFTVKDNELGSRFEKETLIPENIFSLHWPKTEGHRIHKQRIKRAYRGRTIEFDVYADRDLVVAEVEFGDPTEADRFSPLGKNVTYDAAYKNRNLAR
ncbi:MAG: hypothetical protein Q7R76_03500 [Candidatus Woesearchaeota archaeon]|nr:hypothetical protein [Candidatus Woesearchaeota archaeon]